MSKSEERKARLEKFAEEFAALTKNKDQAATYRIADSLPVIEDSQVMALFFTRNPKLKKREEEAREQEQEQEEEQTAEE